MTKIISRIIITVKDPKLGLAMALALTPDNIIVPPKVKVKSSFKDHHLVIQIQVSDNSGGFLHTFNDIMRCLVAIDKSINLLSQIEKKSV